MDSPSADLKVIFPLELGASGEEGEEDYVASGAGTLFLGEDNRESRGGDLGKAGSHFSVPALNPSHSGDKCGTSFSEQVRKLRLPSITCPVSITWSHATLPHARTACVWSWQWPTLDYMAGSGNKTGIGGERYKPLHPVSLSDPS